jgi:hypothetical protein
MNVTVTTPDSLGHCHAVLAGLLGSEIEPLSVAREVDEHRQYWRPKNPKLVLLAESHVRTTEAELQGTIKALDSIPKSIPRSFVKFVYCLGYGESELLSGPVKSNPGTVHFWKIFHSCLNSVNQKEDFASLLKARTSLPERLDNKLRLLERMKVEGIWLVDASIVALYQRGSPKPRTTLYNQVLKSSWKEYVCSLIEEARPDGILCVGFAVARALKTELDKLRSERGIKWGVVKQPNARLSSTEHLCIFDAYHRVSNKPKHARALSKKWFRQCFPTKE